MEIKEKQSAVAEAFGKVCEWGDPRLTFTYSAGEKFPYFRLQFRDNRGQCIAVSYFEPDKATSFGEKSSELSGGLFSALIGATANFENGYEYPLILDSSNPKELRFLYEETGIAIPITDTALEFLHDALKDFN